jgi:hypothetical protein
MRGTTVARTYFDLGQLFDFLQRIFNIVLELLLRFEHMPPLGLDSLKACPGRREGWNE